MIRYKERAILYIYIISSVCQVSLVQSQWDRGYTDYGSYYVPYSRTAGSTFTTSGPVNFVPVQGPQDNSGILFPIQNTAQHLDTYPPYWQYPPNAPYSPYDSLIYSNSPSVEYQGLKQANALRSAYPNQPIIIINNGGNGDTGENSNNGNTIGKKGDGFNFGDLAAIFLATRKRHGPEGLGDPEPETKPEVATPTVIPSQRVRPGLDNNFTNEDGAKQSYGNNKYSTVTHITIILPSSGSTVSVEDKKKNAENKSKKDEVDEQKKHKKENEEFNTKYKEYKNCSDEKIKQDEMDEELVQNDEIYVIKCTILYYCVLIFFSLLILGK